MNRATPEGWSRLGETALLSLVFLAPLAVHGRTWDPAALRTALLQAAALTLAAAWLLKGLARGRWEAPAAAWTALFPALALAAWTLARFALEPFKAAAVPGLAMTLSTLTVFAVAAAEFGGARHAARLAFWTTAAAVAAAALAASERFALGPGVSATLTSPDQLAAFAAAALPVALAARLDPEASASRRLLALSAAAALAVTAAWSGSARGLAYLCVSAVAYAAVAAVILRGPQARRNAGAALACAALAVAAFAAESRGVFARSGEPFLDSAALRGLSGGGLLGALLLGWTILAALGRGLGAASALRLRGAAAEAGYAAGFSAAFLAWAACAALGLAPASGPAAWLAWAAGGVAAGLSPLSRARGMVRVMPLPFGEDARRLLQGPALLAFAALAVWPGLWLVSDVRYNRAVAEARAGGLDAALADAGRVWPGAAVYAPSLYLRGRVLMEQGRPAEALAAFSRLDSVAPDLGRVHGRKAEAYAALGDWASSARERERQASLTPLDAANLAAWAEAARASGDLDGARRAAARAEAVAPEDEAVRAQLAANELMERTLTERGAARRKDGRKGLARRPDPKKR